MYKQSSASRQPREGNANPFMSPALALNLFWPIVPGTQQLNARAIDGCGKVATEWLDFVHRRLSEDVRLVGHLAASGSPAEAWSLYADFWQQAIRDYWSEYATMGKLSSEIMSGSVNAASTHTASVNAGGAHTAGVDAAEGRRQKAPGEVSPSQQAA
jgi:Phasin protein